MGSDGAYTGDVQTADGMTAVHFVSVAQPLLQRKDLPALIAALRGRFGSEQIQGFLSRGQPDARQLAAFALGLMGDRECVPALAGALADADPATRDLAEHALWSVWFRLGSPCANRCLARAAQCMDSCDFPGAEGLITKALEQSPNFAEAYNQRAILHYLSDRFELSLADCRRAVAIMPLHFGAWAGLGHCYCQLDQRAAALRSYQKALSINPHLDGIREAVSELRRSRGPDLA